MGARDVRLAGIAELRRLRTGILTGLHLGVVGVDLGVVRVHRGLGRLHPRFVGFDGVLGLALGPLDRVRVRVERLGGLVTGVRRTHPLLGLHGELLAERLGRLALPVGGVQLAHAVADLVEGRVEVLEVLGALLDAADVAVDEFACLLGLAELLFAGVAPRADAALSPQSSTLSATPRRPMSSRRSPAVVRALVDAFADELLAVVVDLFGLADDRVGGALEPVAHAVRNPAAHQPAPPPRWFSSAPAWAACSRSSREGPYCWSSHASYCWSVIPIDSCGSTGPFWRTGDVSTSR